MNADHADLIARLEKATGEDRELDCLIEGIHPTASGDTPHYSASIDAALTLVPKGFAWTLASQGTTDFRFFASVAFPDEDCDGTPTLAATPAIALCIAALRARAAAPRSSMFSLTANRLTAQPKTCGA